MIVLHYTGMPDNQAAINRLCNPDEQGVRALCRAAGRPHRPAGRGSAARLARRHVVLGRRDRHQFVLDRHRDRQSRARPRLSRLSQAADRGGDRALPQHLRRAIESRRDRVLAHSDVAPARKQDPGEKFPWKAAGRFRHRPLGQACAASNRAGPIFALGETSPTIEEMQELLAQYGYGVAATGYLDAHHARRRRRLPAPFPSGPGRRRHRRLHAGDAEGAACRPRRRGSKAATSPVEAYLTPAPRSSPSLKGQSAGRPLGPTPKGGPGGKSGLHGHTVPDNVRRAQAQGKCHREQTAVPCLPACGENDGTARVKRCGKSAPRVRQRRRHGKPHREQDRIGTARDPQAMPGIDVRIRPSG